MITGSATFWARINGDESPLVDPVVLAGGVGWIRLRVIPIRGKCQGKVDDIRLESVSSSGCGSVFDIAEVSRCSPGSIVMTRGDVGSIALSALCA